MYFTQKMLFVWSDICCEACLGILCNFFIFFICLFHFFFSASLIKNKWECKFSFRPMLWLIQLDASCARIRSHTRKNVIVWKFIIVQIGWKEMAKQQPGNRKQHLEKEEINWKLEHQGSMRFRRNIYTCET